MYSNAYVWSRVLSYLEQHSPAIAIASYFDDAEVIELTESKLVIYSPSPFRKDVIVKRYIDQIREAMRDQFQTEVEVVVLDETELPQYSKNKKNRNFVEFNSQYTFDKFVVGSSNQHAFSAARAVADNPADAYNPLFIYGESGLGKTHLLYAIANQIQREHPDYNIVYIKGDQFTNELIDAVRSGKNFEFRDKYRNADLLLMDDIQFIAGKDATQEEFFHTFNSLYENKRQIVLTSDRVPGDMVRLEDRLRTRFEWGLIVDVQPPDYETRFIITREKALVLQCHAGATIGIAHLVQCQRLFNVLRKVQAHAFHKGCLLLLGAGTGALFAGALPAAGQQVQQLCQIDGLQLFAAKRDFRAAGGHLAGILHRLEHLAHRFCQLAQTAFFGVAEPHMAAAERIHRTAVRGKFHAEHLRRNFAHCAHGKQLCGLVEQNLPGAQQHPVGIAQLFHHTAFYIYQQPALTGALRRLLANAPFGFRRAGNPCYPQRPFIPIHAFTSPVQVASSLAVQFWPAPLLNTPGGSCVAAGNCSLPGKLSTSPRR